MDSDPTDQEPTASTPTAANDDHDEGGEGQPLGHALPARAYPALEREARVDEWNMQSVLELVMRDPVAMRRGIRLVRLHHEDWQRLGEPLALHCPRSLGDVSYVYTVPVENTGKRKGWVRWLYRRAKDGAPRQFAPRNRSTRPPGVD